MANAKKIVQTDAAPKALGPYSQAVVANGLVFCAGQIPLDPATGNIVEGGIAEQTHQVLKNLRAVLKAAGSDLDQAVKTTVFLKSMDSFVGHERGLRPPGIFRQRHARALDRRSRPPAARRHGRDRSRRPGLAIVADPVTWLLALGSFTVFFLLVVHLLLALVLIIPTWRICTRAGFSGALSLFHLVPVIGSFIVMGMLAFSTWPAGEAAPRR